MVTVNEHLDLLGKTVKDRVSRLKGVVTSISFDLYGCVQVLVNPGTDEGGRLGDQFWFDVSRIEVTGKRVMPKPAFETDKGPDKKPIPR